MNRTISVTVNEQALMQALEWLKENGLGEEVRALASIPRLCVMVVAQQLGGKPVRDATIKAFGRLAMAGRRSTTQQAPTPTLTITAPKKEVPLPLPTEKEVFDYVAYLEKNNLTAEEFPFEEFKRLGG
jgi:hypothetical protein